MSQPSDNDPEIDQPSTNISDSLASPSRSPSPARPNRWTGAPSTWRSLTSQERGLAASLDLLRNADLSIHLYNAFSLRKSALDIENGVIDVEEGVGVGLLPDGERTFKPPGFWTAWPLRPEVVPREGEIVGPGDGEEGFTYRSSEYGEEMPSLTLEEVLIGVTVRIAKERFLGRGEAGEDEGLDFEEQLEGDDDLEERIGGVDEEGSGGEDAPAGNQEAAQNAEDFVEPIIKEASETPESQIRLKPVVSADDDRSRELLRPSIRHTLSKLDEVLMALHQARKTARQYSHSSANTDDETPVLDAPTRIPKKAQGRPRKFANLPDRSKGSQAPPIDPADLFRAKNTHRGRPQKVYERLEGESQQDYLVRIARIQKKPLPVFAPPRETPEISESAERSRKSPARRANSEEIWKDRQRRMKPRDWSEVLSAAALVGFPPDVVARATQRCANLFGESMILRSMAEMPFSEKDGDILTQYRPQTIPRLDDEEVATSSDEESGDSSSTSSNGSRSRRRSKNPAQRAPACLRQKYSCSIPKCPRKTRGFNEISSLKKHLQQGHQIPKDEIEEYILPSDEEMYGAVHIDGFLELVKRMGGARGRYRKEGKRTRDVSDDEEVSEEGEGLERGERREARVTMWDSEKEEDSSEDA